MEWLACSIAFVATIYFAIHYRGFRRGLMFVAGGLVALSAAWVIYFWHDNRQTKARRQIASRLIRPDQIEILDAKLAIGSSPKVSGTIVNRSDHELSELAIKVWVSDCPRYQKNHFDQFDDALTLEPHGDGNAPAKSDDEWWKSSPLAPTHTGKPTAPAQSQNSKTAPNPKDGEPWERYKKERDDAQCGIVGEGVEHLYLINVPKGQKRAFETYVTLPKLPEMNEWSWNYAIQEAIAKY